MIEVESIIRKMKQGRTEPYLCEADDGNTYVVKGSNATNAGLVKEWIVAHLGQQFGLPVPPFKIAWVDDVLVEYSSFDLEAGYCFASLYQPNIQEITFNQLKDIDIQQLKNLFMFDYWIRNNDRNLTELGGNPNLFLDQKTKSPYVLDHNLCFANDFIIDEHRGEHACASIWGGLDLVDQQAYEQKFENALGALQPAINTLPEEWLETFPLDRIQQEIVVVLNEFRSNQFWEGIR